MIRKLNKQDNDALKPYEHDSLSMLSNNNYINYGYFNNNELVGYLLTTNSDVIDIINIYVKEDQRHKKIGTNLLTHLINEQKNKKIMLEVSINNKIAISFYNKLGFKQISIRKDYYGLHNDAIIMQLERK